VVVLSQLAGFIVLAALLPLLPAAAPETRDLLWGAAAGACVGVGIAFLYRALAVGRMAVIAPATAVCAVVIPVAAAILLGERPGITVLAGIGLALVSIVLVGQSGREGPATGARLPAGFGLALTAGAAIGLFFLAIARVAPAAGLWPLLAARGVSVLLLGAAAIVGRRPVGMPAPVAAMVVAGGVIDMLANALYLIATHHGALSVVVTLASLYPASTVLLALVVLGERLNAVQGVGIACALIAVVLIVAR
jgi:drug/metabolite transporter (DMT)-like permease